MVLKPAAKLHVSDQPLDEVSAACLNKTEGHCHVSMVLVVVAYGNLNVVVESRTQCCHSFIHSFIHLFSHSFSH